MAAWRILVLAAATAFASMAFGAASVAALRQRIVDASRSRAIPLLFGLICLFLALAALRQVAASMSQLDPDYELWDKAIYLVLLVPAATPILPLTQVVIHARFGTPRAAWTSAILLGALVAVGLFFAYKDGVSGPLESAWGTDWTINSRITGYVLVGAILIPATLLSAWIARLSTRMDHPAERRRLRLVGISCFVYFLFFTLDAFGLQGLALLGARLGTAVAGVVAWMAYRKPLPDRFFTGL